MASSTDQDSICNFLGIAERVVDTNGADQHECHVHTLTAKFFLNRPLEDLIPTEFIKRAERTSKCLFFSFYISFCDASGKLNTVPLG